MFWNKIRQKAIKTKEIEVKLPTRKYGRIWSKYKQFVAPATRQHYEWIFETAEYKCIALVENDLRQYPFKDVIHIPHRALNAKQSFLEFLMVRLHFKRALIKQQPIPAFTDKELQAGVKNQ